MRVYFEKPRTSIGWKGLINDPHLDDSFQIEEGLRIGRKLLLDIADLGLPTSTEALDPISPQYLQDLIAWSAIGARTTESQTHREMSSGLSSPVGFKNGTDGGLMVAINAMQSVSSPHRFLGINGDGQVSVVTTRGNPYATWCCAVAARGPISIRLTLNSASRRWRRERKPEHHDRLQPCQLRQEPRSTAGSAERCDGADTGGNRSIIGAMLESNIHHGNQSIPADLGELKYGVSVTDACMDWE